MDVVLQGRWRVVAADLDVGICVQVDCAAVLSQDGDGTEAMYLELSDPIREKERATLVALHVLNDDMVPTKTLAYPSLNGSICPLAEVKGSRFPQIRPSHGSSIAVTNPEHKDRRCDETKACEYVYTSVLDAFEKSPGRLAAGKAEMLHLYGVVVDFRAPFTATGSNFLCEVIIADESSVQPGSSAELKTISIHCVEDSPEKCIPFRCVGDVVRARRLHFGLQKDEGPVATTIVAESRCYSTFLIWGHSDTDFHPLACKGPRGISRTRSPALDSVRYIITSNDGARITALREWTQDILFRAPKVHRPFLRSVLDVKAAHPSSEFLSQRVDLLCRIEAEYTDQANLMALKFIVSDGLLPKGTGSQNLLVESDVPSIQAFGTLQRSFVDFCPSREGRQRENAPHMRLLIRDTRITIRGADRVVKMSAGERTTTLLWLPPNSLEIREVAERLNKQIASSPLPHLIAISSTMDTSIQVRTYLPSIKSLPLYPPVAMQAINSLFVQPPPIRTPGFGPLTRRPHASLRPRKLPRVNRRGGVGIGVKETANERSPEIFVVHNEYGTCETRRRIPGYTSGFVVTLVIRIKT